MLKQNKFIWWKLDNKFDDLNIFEIKDKLGQKKNTVLNSTTVNEVLLNIDLINRYFSLMKLIRITAYYLRFLENCKLESEIRKCD